MVILKIKIPKKKKKKIVFQLMVWHKVQDNIYHLRQQVIVDQIIIKPIIITKVDQHTLVMLV